MRSRPTRSMLRFGMGAKMVDLTGAVTESALIRELQWDTFGTDVLHIDLMRVDASELLTVEVPVELRGEAPGMKSGGVVKHAEHKVEIEIAASDVPERPAYEHQQLGVGWFLNCGPRSKTCLRERN